MVTADKTEMPTKSSTATTIGNSWSRNGGALEGAAILKSLCSILRLESADRQEADDSAREPACHRAGYERAHGERHEFVPAFRHHPAHARDHDADGARIGEAAHGVKHNKSCTRVERTL